MCTVVGYNQLQQDKPLPAKCDCVQYFYGFTSTYSYSTQEALEHPHADCSYLIVLTYISCIVLHTAQKIPLWNDLAVGLIFNSVKHINYKLCE